MAEDGETACPLVRIGLSAGDLFIREVAAKLLERFCAEKPTFHVSNGGAV